MRSVPGSPKLISLAGLASRSCPGFLRGRSRLFWSCGAEPNEEWEERCDFEGHLIGGGGDGNGLRLDQFELIVPRIDLYPATERQSRDLVHLLRVKLW